MTVNTAAYLANSAPVNVFHVKVHNVVTERRLDRRVTDEAIEPITKRLSLRDKPPSQESCHPEW